MGEVTLDKDKPTAYNRGIWQVYPSHKFDLLQDVLLAILEPLVRVLLHYF